MGQLKLLAVSATCALAIMAMAGTDAASATRFCSTKGPTCFPETKIWPAGTEFDSEVKVPFQINTSAGNLTCNKSLFSGETTTAGGGAGVAVGMIGTSLAFYECKIGSTPCTVARAENLPYKMAAGWISGDDGALEFSPAMEFSCIPAMGSCLFTAPGAKLELIGSEAAELKAKEITLSRQGLGCPTSAKWNAIYTVSSPGPLYVTKE